jgi:hypothetical protein
MLASSGSVAMGTVSVRLLLQVGILHLLIRRLQPANSLRTCSGRWLAAFPKLFQFHRVGGAFGTVPVPSVLSG